MSLGIVIKGPEGLVLAADSRVTVSAETSSSVEIHVNFDNATKLLSFSEPNNYVGAVTYGQAAIGLRTANSFLPEFEANLPDDRLGILDFAKRLSEFFINQWNKVMPPDYDGPSMTFVIAGFDVDAPYGSVFLFDIPQRPKPTSMRNNDEFGITWGGQREIVDRLLRGYDERLIAIAGKTLNLTKDDLAQLQESLNQLQLPVPILAMALQDCVDLAVYFVQTTILGQRLTVGIRGVGGPIDVASITRKDGFKFIQQKAICVD